MTDQHRALSTQQPRSAFRQREEEAEHQKPKADGREGLGVEAVVEAWAAILRRWLVVVALTGKAMPEQAETQAAARVEVEGRRQAAQARRPFHPSAALATHGLTGRHTAGAEEERMEDQQMEVQAALEVEEPQAFIQPQRARSTPEGEEEGLGLIQPQQAAPAVPASSSSPFRGSCDGPLR